MAGIKLLGLGKARGEKIMTNDDMASLVDTSDRWIREKSGIRSRYFAKEKTNTDLAAEAAEAAIQRAGIDREDIACCVVCTFTADDQTPATACGVAGRLGLREEILALDLNGACAGFIYGCQLANGLLSLDRDRYALVIGSEKISPFMDMEDRSTCVLFGDGAGAAVLAWDQAADFFFYGGCRPDREVLHCQRGGFIQMGGQEVYRFAVSVVPKAIKGALAVAELEESDIDYFVCHQANERIIDAAARRIGGDPDKFFKNLYSYGNTSAASIPIALCEMEEQGLLREGARLACTGFGAGLTYGCMVISK